MKKRIIIILLMFPLCCSAQMDPIYDIFKASFKDLISNCSMDYSSKCVYPDSSEIIINGVMCMQKNQYYDSSNARLVLFNEKWFLHVDHLEKEVAVMFMPNWEKQFKNNGKFFISEFLFSDSVIYKHSKIVKDKIINGTYWVHIKFDKTIDNLKELSIQYSENSIVPIQYQGRVLYPIDYDRVFNNEDIIVEELPSAYADVSFKCFNIKRDVKVALLDENRFIEYRDKGAYLKQFKKYKMYNTKF